MREAMPSGIARFDQEFGCEETNPGRHEAVRATCQRAADPRETANVALSSS
jgi:hypothetical protein